TTAARVQDEADADAIERLIDARGRPLRVMAEEVSPACVVRLLRRRDRGLPPVAAIHPPEYGHWRKAMLEDIAILTGGRVVARDLGGRMTGLEGRGLGSAREGRGGFGFSVGAGGAGGPAPNATQRRRIRRPNHAVRRHVARG